MKKLALFFTFFLASSIALFCQGNQYEPFPFLPKSGPCTGECEIDEVIWNMNNDIVVTSSEYTDENGKPCEIHVKFAWRICECVLYIVHQELYCEPYNSYCWAQMRSSKEIIDLVYKGAIEYLNQFGYLEKMATDCAIPQIPVAGYVRGSGCTGYCAYDDPVRNVVWIFNKSCKEENDLLCCTVDYLVEIVNGEVVYRVETSNDDTCPNNIDCRQTRVIEGRTLQLNVNAPDCKVTCPQIGK